MDLKLSDDQFREIVSKSILESLTPETRLELLKKGINSVLHASGGCYDKKSLLQVHFEQAVSEASKEMVAAELNKDSIFMAKLRALIQDAMLKVFDDQGREKIQVKISEAIAEALWKDRY